MKKQISMVMLLVVIGVMLLSGCINQNDSGDGTVPIDDKTTDPVSGGVPVARGAGIVTEDKVSDDTSGEVGYIGKEYPVNNIPTTIVFPYSKGQRKDLDNFKILNLRHENGEIKFCVKDSERTRPYEGGLTLQVSVNGYVIQRFRIDEPKTECYEVSPNLEAIGDVQSILIRISNIS